MAPKCVPTKWNLFKLNGNSAQSSLETALNNQLPSAEHREMMVPSLSLNGIRERKQNTGVANQNHAGVHRCRAYGTKQTSYNQVQKSRHLEISTTQSLKKQKEKNKLWYSILL